MSKTIQVFLNGSEHAEISAELIKFEIKKNCLWITFKELDYVGTTVFPLTSVSFFRLIDEDEDEK